jgi:hypothetical protein
MTDPSTLVRCPVCKGKMILTSDPCPYPADVEPVCEECYITDCGHVEVCDACDGTGQMTAADRKTILNGMEI